MHKLLFIIFLAGALVFSIPLQAAQPAPYEVNLLPEIIKNEAPTGWSSETLLYSLRCPAPSDWTNQNNWMVVLLKKGETLMGCLETPAGRVNDILVDEKRQLAVVSLQLDTATFMIYMVSWKERKVWAANTKVLEDAASERRAREAPQTRYPLSHSQLVGLRQKGNIVEGLMRTRSALNPEDHHSSMLIRFTIDLSAPQPAAGGHWPLAVTKVEDSAKEREWKPGNRDFNPPLQSQE